MDKETADIRDGFIKMAAQDGPTVTELATVKAINNDDTIVVEIFNGLEIDDVRLKSVIKDGNKIILEPSLNSEVLITNIDNGGEYVVLAVESIARMYVKIGALEFELKDKFSVKSGAASLKDILQNIIEAVQQIVVIYGNNPDYAKLTQAATDLNLLME